MGPLDPTSSPPLSAHNWKKVLNQIFFLQRTEVLHTPGQIISLFIFYLVLHSLYLGYCLGPPPL